MSDDAAAATAVTDENIESEVEKIDLDEAVSTTTTATTTTAGTDGAEAEVKEPKSMRDLVTAMNKHGDGTNMMKEGIKTFSSMDGVEKQGDVVIEAEEMETKGVALLQQMIREAKEKNEALPEKKRSVKWEFRTSPHAQFGKTLDDTYLSFLKWARKEKKSNKEDKKKKDKKDKKKKKDDTQTTTEEEKSETETTTTTTTAPAPRILNVNKAFRRLESYADWMDSSKEDLKETLTYESIKEPLASWGMKSTIDKTNQFVWWIDMKKIDTKAVKKTPPEESMRAFVWYAHFMMYNTNAQDYGMTISENCEGCGFIEMLTLMPMKLSTKLDRLTMGVLPVKMNTCYIMESPTWLTLMMKFIKVFMSKKLRDRIVIVQDWETLVQNIGEEGIPQGFGKCKGNENCVDLVEQFVAAS